MAPDLVVWLYGEVVARVLDTSRRGRPRIDLEYSEEALSSHPLNSAPVSVSMPLLPGRPPVGAAQAFFDGLLPEGDARAAIAREAGVDSGDLYQLLVARGGDCAGALVVRGLDAGPPEPDRVGASEPIDEERLAALIRDLRFHPLGYHRGATRRVSLAGVQEKLLVRRTEEGWALPLGDTPSTHILKPLIRRFTGTVANEAFCMRLAAHAGLEAAGVDVIEVAGDPVLVVERFDRECVGNEVVRVHQEDLCQASTTPPGQKYEAEGGPSLAKVATILDTWAPHGELDHLLEQVTFHVLIGNADAHAKNYSLLHHRGGAVRLSPVYDAMSTLYYRDELDPFAAMGIDSVRRIDRVTPDRVVNEAVSWGMPRTRASDVVEATLRDLAAGIDSVASELATTLATTPRLVELVEGRARSLLGTR